MSEWQFDSMDFSFGQRPRRPLQSSRYSCSPVLGWVWARMPKPYRWEPVLDARLRDHAREARLTIERELALTLYGRAVQFNCQRCGEEQAPRAFLALIACSHCGHEHDFRALFEYPRVSFEGTVS